MALTVSPPALASPITLAFEACACSRYDEKSEVLSGCRTLPSTLPPDLLHHIGGVFFEILAEGVIGSQEIPAI